MLRTTYHLLRITTLCAEHSLLTSGQANLREETGARVSGVGVDYGSGNVLHDVALSLLLESKGVQPTHSNAFHYVYRPPPHCSRRAGPAAATDCAPRVSTDPARRTDPARPVSFHLRAKPVTAQP